MEAVIFINGHGSNVKVVDPILRKLRYETGAWGVAPTMPSGELTAKKTPGWSAQAAMSAMMPT